MSTISVVQYQSSPQKLNVLQQNTQNVQNSNLNREIIIVHKPQMQTSTLNPKDILLTNPARKKSKPGEKLTHPAPVAVARRNARERNRVKQVNNGFATLRQHIPTSIAAAFESSNGRGGSKKLSKVETLRMAVEYIRTLEDMLSGDTTLENVDQSYSEISGNISTSSNSTGNSYNSFPSSSSTPGSSPTTTAITTNLSNMYTYSAIMSPTGDEDDLNIRSLSTTGTPSHVNFTTSTKTYQIPLSDLYDTDNLDSLDGNMLSDPSLIDADIDLLHTMHTTGSLSPEMYSDNSLSPISIDRCRSTNDQMFIPVFNSTNEDIKLRITPEMIMEIKSEPLEEDSKENMIQVMQWWEPQQSRS